VITSRHQLLMPSCLSTIFTLAHTSEVPPQAPAPVLQMWRGAAYIFFMTGLKGRGVIHLACIWVYLTSYVSSPSSSSLYIFRILLFFLSFQSSLLHPLVFFLILITSSSSSPFLPYPLHPSRLLSSLIIPSFTCSLFYTFLIFLFFLSFPCSLPHSSNPLPYPHIFLVFLSHLFLILTIHSSSHFYLSLKYLLLLLFL
jgi:hypothetical protein